MAKISIGLNKDSEYLPFISETLSNMEDKEVDSIGIVFLLKNKIAVTAYFNCNIIDKITMKNHIELDITDEFILKNIDRYINKYESTCESNEE